MASETDAKTIERELIMRLVTNLAALIVGAAVAVVANWVGVKPPEVITVPVSVQAAPAPAADDGGLMFEARPRLIGLRSRIRAEIERRAALPAGDPSHVSAERVAEANQFVGKLGDGHLLRMLIEWGPEILAFVVKLLALLAVL